MRNESPGALGATQRRLLALPLALAGVAALSQASAQSFASGAVYTSTNDAAGNQVAVFARETDGALSLEGFVDTGGLGSGSGLGSQGAVRLSDSLSFLFVVNAGSDELSVFRVHENGLELVDVEPTRGAMPVSVAQHDELVYVLNAGSDTVQGFHLDPNGGLDPLLEFRARLSGRGTDAAQVEFGPEARYLYVTERATNVIDRFRLVDGRPVERVSMPSVGQTPFGFTMGNRGQLFVAEAAGGAAQQGTVTSYQMGGVGLLAPITLQVPTTQTATCWVVATPDRRVLYASNTGSDSITSLRVGYEGNLEVAQPVAATTGAGPLDLAITPDGQFLYSLAGSAGSVDDYRIEASAVLISLPGLHGGLPTTSAGLAAR